MKPRLLWVWVFLFGLVSLLISVNAAQAADGVVGNGSPESCTETAFNNALAATTSGGTLSFNCGSAPYTLTVTSAKLISTPITIDGGNLITLSGGGTTTVLELNDYLPLLTLQNITIADGYARPAGPAGVCRSNACGGGVRGHYRASLTVINSKFINNKAAASALQRSTSLDFGGGAIYLHTGDLTVTNSQFTSNQAINSSGGAIHILHSNATFTDVTFSNNQSDYYGGAFYSDGTINDGENITTDGLIEFSRTSFLGNSTKGQGGAVFNYMYVNRQPNVLTTYTDVTFSGNTVSVDPFGDALGGALRIGNGPANVMNATFIGNISGRDGGAIWTGEAARVTVANSTFYNNDATGVNENDGFGGAIKISNSGGFTLSSSTFASNHAGQLGGAISSSKTGVVVNNNIFADNTATNPWGINQNCEKTFTGKNNLQTPPPTASETACVTGVSGTLFGNPQLLPLADNGGFVQTMALAASSPAIDAGSTTDCPEKDPRGYFRTFDGNWDGIEGCDIGAYEFYSFDVPSAPNARPYRNFFDVSQATLAWGRVEWAVQYEIQVDNNVDFSSVNLLYSVGIDPLMITIEPLPSGVYHWRVRAQHNDGTWGGWSQPDEFLIYTP